MAYETQAGLPTKGLTYSKMLEHLREAQDCAAMMAHLYRANDDKLVAQGWLGVEELLKRLCHQITEMAKRGLQ
jgi:hypothetical protein